MKEPSPRSSRLLLAGLLGVAIVAGGTGFLIGRNATGQSPPPAASPPPAPPAPEPEPAPRGALGRADLIALAALAADRAAKGAESGREIAEADGRRFELRLPFGCEGPADGDESAAMRWRYDAEAEALRVHVEPTAWPAEQWWPRDASADAEAVEGFWIARPWTSSEDCPVGANRPSATGAEAVTLPGQTLAIGQVVPADPSGGRKSDGRSFDAVARVPEDAVSKGLRLRISGRIQSLPGSGPIRCRQPASPEQRPICLIGMVMDEVAIENPATGTILATWNVPLHNAPGR